MTRDCRERRSTVPTCASFWSTYRSLNALSAKWCPSFVLVAGWQVFEADSVSLVCDPPSPAWTRLFDAYTAYSSAQKIDLLSDDASPVCFVTRSR